MSSTYLKRNWQRFRTMKNNTPPLRFHIFRENFPARESLEYKIDNLLVCLAQRNFQDTALSIGIFFRSFAVDAGITGYAEYLIVVAYEKKTGRQLVHTIRG